MSLNLPGLPPHNIQLKVGSVVIMLRNINPLHLFNGTRLSVKKKVLNNIVEATFLKGKYKGQVREGLIHHIPMTYHLNLYDCKFQSCGYLSQ